MATKMKGLLKGLRYISQIFDDDKEPEMQIGFPTDVKHVAHIGWDGPVSNSPSWLDNFKLDQDSLSGPLRTDDSSLRGSLHGGSPARDFPDLPKSSRRCSANGDILSTDSWKREKSEKTTSRHSRKSHSGSEVSDMSSSRSSSRNYLLPDLASGGSESPSHNLPDIPRKTRRKKSKDSSQGGSGTSKSSSRTAKAIAEASSYTSSPFSDTGLGSVPQLRNNDLYTCPSPNSHPFDETSDKKLKGFS